jgi:hypothetical protein
MEVLQKCQDELSELAWKGSTFKGLDKHNWEENK